MRRVIEHISDVLNSEDINEEKGYRQIQDEFLVCETFSDGCRCGEPCRMTVEQAKDGVQNMWIGNLACFFYACFTRLSLGE